MQGRTDDGRGDAGHVSASKEVEESGSLLGVFRVKTFKTISPPCGHLDNGSGTRYRAEFQKRSNRTQIEMMDEYE